MEYEYTLYWFLMMNLNYFAGERKDQLFVLSSPHLLYYTYEKNCCIGFFD